MDDLIGPSNWLYRWWTSRRTGDPLRLRHPLETRVAILVGVVDVVLAVTIVVFLFLGAEWLETWPLLTKYVRNAKFFLILVLGAPVVATFMRRRRRYLAQEESIRIDEMQFPEVHAVLVKHCQRVGIPIPELYISGRVEHTTSFSWGDRQCIILSTHDFSECPEAFRELADFVLAREVGSICLGHTSYVNELLASSVAPFPFLRGPLNRLRTYSRDRYGAYLAPSSLRAMIVEAAGDPLYLHVDPESYLSQLDEEVKASRAFDSIVWLFLKRVPLAHRVMELRRAGMLKAA
jgi:hypothetical protein